MRLIRKSLAAMKARQYQVVAVCGIMDTEYEYQVINSFSNIRLKFIGSVKCVFLYDLTSNLEKGFENLRIP